MKLTNISILLIGLNCITNFSFGQANKIKWQKNLGGPGADDGYSLQQTSDGGFICTGLSNSNSGQVTGNHGDYDYWLAKLNSNGNFMWGKSYGGSKKDYAYSVKQTTDGGYIIGGISASVDGDVTGSHEGAHSVVNDYWIVKTDSVGNIQWKYCYGGKLDDILFDIELTSDGGYIVCGNTYSHDGNVTGNKGVANAWLLKLNSVGKIMWERTYGGSMYEGATSIKQLPSGSYIFSGYSYSTDGDVTDHHGTTQFPDFWINKIEASGNIIWSKSFGGDNEDYPNSLSILPDGTFVIAGYSSSANGDVTMNHGSRDYWVIRIDSNATLLNQISLGGSYNEIAYSVKALNDGGCTIAGYSDSRDADVKKHHGSAGTSDYWIVRLDANLNLVNQADLGGTSYDIAYDIVNIDKGGYAVLGYALSSDGDITNPLGSDDYWLVKLKKNALDSSLPGIDELKDPNAVQTASETSNLNSMVVTPTITTGAFKINLQLPANLQSATVKIFNCMGQQVQAKKAALTDGIFQTEIILYAILPKGLYFVRITTGEKQYTGKIILE